jgi:hypothetical protein
MDIVERLRKLPAAISEKNAAQTIYEVSEDAISEIERLREALKKIANDEPPYVAEYGYNRIKDIARSALKGDE